MLFGATGYGATGDFVRSLPLTEKEVFAGKLLTAFGLFLLLMLSQICIARALSITIHWRTLALNSPPILLMLVLLSLCATALYSVCEIVLLLLCAGVYVLLWRFAPLSKAVLLAILTALQLVGMFAFIKLNGWMLEKKYAV